MRVGQRLLLAVVPAIVGLFAVAALAYWGQYQRQAPEIVVVVAAIAAIGSFILAWQNTRYVAHRVERIASRSSAEAPAKGDELDEIEESVHGLHDSVRETQVKSAARESAAEQRAEEWGALLDEVVSEVADGVRAVQLPLHILLESKFGTLNENQEEMLEAARAAAEEADVQLRRTRKLIEVERGALVVHARPVGLAELLRPAFAIVEARAMKRNVSLTHTASTTAPRALVDPVHAQEAVTIALTELVDRAAPGATLKADAGEGEAGTVRFHVTGDLSAIKPTLPLRLADRLVRAVGGSLTLAAGELTIVLPAERDRQAPA